MKNNTEALNQENTAEVRRSTSMKSSLDSNAGLEPSGTRQNQPPLPFLSPQLEYYSNMTGPGWGHTMNGNFYLTNLPVLVFNNFETGRPIISPPRNIQQSSSSLQNDDARRLRLHPATSNPEGKMQPVLPVSNISSSDNITESSNGRIYIDRVRDFDILCGRGGRSNHHFGNKMYRQLVHDMKMQYRSTEAKKGKTTLSQAIVDHVCSRGGRFVKQDGSSDRYYLLTRAEARKKTSQALREVDRK